MKPTLNEQQFLEQFANADFVMKTQAQIAKDFDRLGYCSHPSLSSQRMSLEELNACVGEMLSTIIQLGETQTLQLLYTIDVPQSKFLALTKDPEFIRKASALIIRREALKVYLRSIY